MRPVKLTIRATAVSAFLLAASVVGCGSKERADGTTSMAGAAGAAGDLSSGGAGGAATFVGTAGSGGAAIDDPTDSAVMMPGTVPSGAGGTVDMGRLFTDAAVVTTTTEDAGATSMPEASTGGDSGGKTAPGDGNVSTCHVGGMSFVLVFTQKGTDVTMVVTASNCAAGNHTIQIHGGFSCDNAGTEGGVWDGARGMGIPALACANNKGSLTYTRSGSDPTSSWTVGDHSTKTDVTLHPMSVDTSCGTFF